MKTDHHPFSSIEILCFPSTLRFTYQSLHLPVIQDWPWLYRLEDSYSASYAIQSISHIPRKYEGSFSWGNIPWCKWNHGCVVTQAMKAGLQFLVFTLWADVMKTAKIISLLVALKLKNTLIVSERQAALALYWPDIRLLVSWRAVKHAHTKVVWWFW